MYDEIKITQLNDFIFCPASIYFHMLYGDADRISSQSAAQLNGTAAHQTIDEATYSTRRNLLTGIDVYCEAYGLIGKIDVFDVDRGILTERKRQVKAIYDGYYFQVYAQCLALREMGYTVRKIRIHSLKDNKTYKIPLPEECAAMFRKFEDTICRMRNFRLEEFEQTCVEKCRNCIYEPACDRGLK